MNQTNTDYLFQVIPSSGDRASSAPRPSGGSAGFNDHLTQASTSVFDVLRQPPRPEPTPRPSRSDQDSTAPSRDSRPPGHNSKSNDSNSRPPNGNTSTDAGTSLNSARSCGAHDNTNDNSDTDNLSSDETAEIAASQSAASGTAQDTEKERHADQTQSNAEAKNGGVEKIGKPGAADEATGTKASAKAGRHLAEINDAANAAVVEAELSNQAASESEATDDDSQASASDKTGKQSRRGSSTNGAGKTAKAESVAEGQQSASVNHAAAAEASANAAGDSKSAKGASRAGSSSKSEKSQDSDDEDSAHGAKVSGRANGRNDVVGAANKTDGAPAANVIASLADTSENGSATNDSDNRALKPVGGTPETAVGPLGRAMRTASEITRGGRSSAQAETPQVDPARFVGRVAKAFNTAQERGGTLHLRLSPPELGSLKVQLTVKDGVMNASLEAENSNARRVLLDHLPALRDRLAEQNIRIDRFDVDVRQENSSGQANPHGSNQNPYQQQQPEQSDSRRQASQQHAIETAAAELPTSIARISNTEINLVV